VTQSMHSTIYQSLHSYQTAINLSTEIAKKYSTVVLMINLILALLQEHQNSKQDAQFMPCWRQRICESKLASWDDDDHTVPRSITVRNNINNMNKDYFGLCDILKY